jgi:hypothetical protein
MRVGTVCYCTDQGLGMLAKSFYEAGVITDVMLMKHRAYLNHPEWYPPLTPMFDQPHLVGPEVEEFLNRVDVVLFFETPFDWMFPKRCRLHGVRTVMMPMYEWFPKDRHREFDKYICPSLLDQEYFPGSPFLTPPVDPARWKLRERATKFLHNAGHIGHRHHKGTEEIIAAIPYLNDDVKLTIRSQCGHLFQLRDKYGHGHPGVTFECGNVPHEELFDGYDAYVAPEKFNGLSLPLQEAYSAGLLVITTDRLPANTWLPRTPMIRPTRIYRACIGRTYHEFDECEVSPKSIAESINFWNGKDITDYSLAGRDWAVEHSWDVMKDKFIEELSS